MLSGVLDVDGFWVTSEEDLAGMKFLKHLILLLKFQSHFLDPLSFQSIEIWDIYSVTEHIAGIEALEATIHLSQLKRRPDPLRGSIGCA